jgi:hypothetical protein
METLKKISRRKRNNCISTLLLFPYSCVELYIRILSSLNFGKHMKVDITLTSGQSKTRESLSGNGMVWRNTRNKDSDSITCI